MPTTPPTAAVVPRRRRYRSSSTCRSTPFPTTLNTHPARKNPPEPPSKVIDHTPHRRSHHCFPLIPSLPFFVAPPAETVDPFPAWRVPAIHLSRSRRSAPIAFCVPQDPRTHPSPPSLATHPPHPPSVSSLRRTTLTGMKHIYGFVAPWSAGNPNVSTVSPLLGAPVTTKHPKPKGGRGGRRVPANHDF